MLYSAFVCLVILFVPKLIEMWKQGLSRGARIQSTTNVIQSQSNDLPHISGGTSSSIDRTGGVPTLVDRSTTYTTRMSTAGLSRGGDGLHDIRLPALDPDIAYSKDTGEMTTFEQFESRLNEAINPKPANSFGNNSLTIDNYGPHSRISGVSPISSRPGISPLDTTYSLSLEYGEGSTPAGPVAFAMSPSPHNPSNKGDSSYSSSSSSSNSNSNSHSNSNYSSTSMVAPNPTGPTRNSEDYRSTVPVNTPVSISPNQAQLNSKSLRARTASTVFDGNDTLSSGTGERCDDGGNDIQMSRMGIFSFGAKDTIRTVPVLVTDKCWWRFLSRLTARWRAMQIFVVSSLNTVFFSDVSLSTHPPFSH